jgi:glyoxylase-like metal-dependent hydrolase (beta-lactamase superfamily II)
MKFGEFEIRTFVEHKLNLDGGAMFGVVPKKIWQKQIEPDENNLIPMVNNQFVLIANGKNIFLDAGIGDTISDTEKSFYGTENGTTMKSGLESIGLNEDDIDYIILTHLHTDHMAGSLKMDEGELVPRFQNAKVLASKKEFSAATNPNERTSAIYKPDRVNALKNAGVLELIDGNEELFPGVKTCFTGGHSEGQFVIEMDSGEQKIFFYSDLLPISQHLPIPYISALDIDPITTLEVKREKLPMIAKDDVVMLYVHDKFMPASKVEFDGKHYRAKKFDIS